MFPSDHVYPPGLPLWRLDEHDFAAQQRVETSQFEQGEDRHREIRTFTPWLARVNTVLTQDGLDELDQWFETDLQAGTLRFDTQVAAFNGELSQWWQAQFVGPYRADGIPGGRYFAVSAELILLDGPYSVEASAGGNGVGPGPRVAPSVFSRSIADSSITATVFSPGVSARMSGDSGIAAVYADENKVMARIEGDSEITLISEAELTDLLLLDGAVGYLLTEGGDRFILEP